MGYLLCILNTIITAYSMASKQRYRKADPEKLKMVKIIRGFFPMGSKGRLRKNEVYLCVLIRNDL